ncbi:ABC transporter substrate-binding protein [Pasteurellaceae bacterium LIM206]|nr:ABC transporter substrate-binding protein [Pasteurellaceae bacterium LIM206]
MNISRRNFIQLTGAGVLAAALPSFAFANQQLTIWGPPVAPTVLLAVAAEMGEARKIRPFNVKSWKTPDELRAGLVNGAIDVSIVPNYVAANLRAQGNPVILYNIMTKGLLSLVSKNGKVSDLSQIAGKKLVMPFKSDMPDLVLQILAQKHNISLDNVVTYTATPPEAITLFLKKDFDFALLPEPLATAAILRGKQMGVTVERSLEFSQVWSDTFKVQHGLLMAGLMIKEQMLKDNSQFFEVLNQDLEKSVVWVNNNPKSAAEIAANYMPAPVPAIERSLPFSALSAVRTNDPEVQKELLAFQQALFKLNPKITGGKAPTTALFGL